MDIETDRLHVRDLEEADLPAIHELQTDPLVRRFVGWPLIETEEDSRIWLSNTLAHNAAQPRFAHSCAIPHRSQGAVAGWIGFGQPSEGEKFGDLDFGYAILPRFWNQGLMTEALRGTLAFIFTAPGVVVVREGEHPRTRAAKSVFGECAVANPASARVMEKAGMRRVADLVDPSAHTEETRHKYRYFIDRGTWEQYARLPFAQRPLCVDGEGVGG